MVKTSNLPPHEGTTMRISGNAKELAKLRYIQSAQEISSRHYSDIKRYEWSMPRGGAKEGAIDKAHMQMIQELANSYLDVHLEMFVAEGFLPDANDMREFKAEIENIVRLKSGGDFWRPSPSINQTLNFLPQGIYINFVNRVRQMELATRVHKPDPSPPPSTTNINTINVYGENRGPMQQAGEGNTQTNGGDDETKH